MVKTTRFFLVAGLVCSAASVALFPGNAQAGFQWTAPVNVEKQPAAVDTVAPPPAMPVPDITLAPLDNAQPYGRTPEIVMDDAPTMMPSPGGQAAYNDDSPYTMPDNAPAPSPYATPAPASPYGGPVTQVPTVDMQVQSGPTPITPRRTPPSRQAQGIPYNGLSQPILDDPAMMAAQPQAPAPQQPQSSGVDFVPTYTGTGPSGYVAPQAPGLAPIPAPAMTPYANEMAMPQVQMQVNPPAAPQPYGQASGQPHQMMAPQTAPSVNYAPIMPQAPQSSYPMAVGFGADLPMMTAIKQIVPADFGLAFEAGVPGDMLVSWQGGRPWNDVLATVLAPHGLEARIQGKMVTIAYNNPNIIPGSFTTGAATPVVTDNSGNNLGAFDTATGQGVLRAPSDAPQVQMAPVFSEEAAQATPVMERNSNGLIQDSSYQSPSSLYQPAAMMQGPGAAPTSLLEPIAAYTPAMEPMTATPASSGNDGDYDGTIMGNWSAAKSSTLREVLDQWARKAGVQLYWASEYDYPISTDINIDGDFEEAVQVLLKGLEESNPRPLGRLHPNLPNGPAVLVIETRRLAD